MNNCFRCGVPLEDGLMECPDCGLKYFDLGSYSDSKPFAIKFQDELGRTYEGMVRLSHIQLEAITEKSSLGNISQDITAQLDLHFIPFDNGNHLTHFIMTEN